MNPIIDSDLIALVSRVKNDALLLLEALYYHYPHLRFHEKGTAFKSAWNEADHPRGQPNNAGQFAPVSFGVSVEEHKEGRAYTTRQPVHVDNPLSRQAKGRLAEHIVTAWLRSLGARDVQEHKTRPNYPIDLFHQAKDGSCEAIEVKAGTIDTKSRNWALTFSRTEAEKEAMEKMSAAEKRVYRQERASELMDRKETARKELEEHFGVQDLKINTITVIIDPDKKLADIFYFEGLHKNIGYNSRKTKPILTATVSYEILDSEAVDPKGARKSEEDDEYYDDEGEYDGEYEDDEYENLWLEA